MTDEQATDWINANAPADLRWWIHDRLRSLASASGSVIRARYRVVVQSVSGRWDNVEIRDDEAIARRDEAEWRSWLNENRKTWKDIRIVKETTTAEVLQNMNYPEHLCK